MATATELYAASIRARVQANLVVPSRVKLLGFGGTARVAIELDPSGTLISTRITKSGGSADIDDTALRSVRTTHFPPFSAQMAPHALTFSLSVRIAP